MAVVLENERMDNGEGADPRNFEDFDGKVSRFRLYSKPLSLSRLDRGLETPVRGHGYKPLQLLRQLLNNKGEPVSKEDLKRAAWSEKYKTADASKEENRADAIQKIDESLEVNLRVAIDRLRASLGETAANTCIAWDGSDYVYAPPPPRPNGGDDHRDPAPSFHFGEFERIWHAEQDRPGRPFFVTDKPWNSEALSLSRLARIVMKLRGEISFTDSFIMKISKLCRNKTFISKCLLSEPKFLNTATMLNSALTLYFLFSDMKIKPWPAENLENLTLMVNEVGDNFRKILFH
jgi:hypothetical protein